MKIKRFICVILDHKWEFCRAMGNLKYFELCSRCHNAIK